MADSNKMQVYDTAVAKIMPPLPYDVINPLIPNLVSLVYIKFGFGKMHTHSTNVIKVSLHLAK